LTESTEKFPESRETFEFPKSKPFNQNYQKFRQISNTAEIPVKKVWKFGYAWRGCPLFRNIPENAVPFVTGNFQKFKPQFFVEWKALISFTPQENNYSIRPCWIRR